MLESRFRHEEHRKDTGTECTIKLLSTNIFNAFLWVLLSRIIHQDIQVTKLIHHLLYRLLAELLIAHITSNSQASASLLLNLPLYPLGIFMCIMIDDSNIRPFLSKGNSNGMTNATITTRDK